jgi:hypothetical protein
MKMEYGKTGNCIYVFRNLEFIFTYNTLYLLTRFLEKMGSIFIHTSILLWSFVCYFLIIDPHWQCPSDAEESSPNPS